MSLQRQRAPSVEPRYQLASVDEDSTAESDDAGEVAAGDLSVDGFGCCSEGLGDLVDGEEIGEAAG